MTEQPKTLLEMITEICKKYNLTSDAKLDLMNLSKASYIKGSDDTWRSLFKPDKKYVN